MLSVAVRSAILTECQEWGELTKHDNGCQAYHEGWPAQDNTCHSCDATTRAYSACNITECYALCEDLYSSYPDGPLDHCKLGCDKYDELGGCSHNTATLQTAVDARVQNRFPIPICARYVRVVVQTWNSWPSMRVGVLLCGGTGGARCPYTSVKWTAMSHPDPVSPNTAELCTWNNVGRDAEWIDQYTGACGVAPTHFPYMPTTCDPPTAAPTASPTAAPTDVPTSTPTSAPTSPTSAPTSAPTWMPTEAPTLGEGWLATVHPPCRGTLCC